jgi:competence protein ComGC
MPTQFSGVFPTVFAVVAVIVVLGIIAVIVLVARNALKARRAGYDPTTMQTDLAVKLLQSDALRGEQTPEARLAKLDALRSAGSITAAEHAAARQRIVDAL